jgi:drug/metabolite transporter (DMT)-like permease
VASVALSPFAIAQLRGRWALLRQSGLSLAMYGIVAIAGCQVFYFNAITHLSVAVALLLEYLATVLIVGWLWLRHGQRPRPGTIAGSASAIGGLVLVLNLASAHRVDPVGVMWALAAMVCLAGYFIFSASLSTLPPMVLACGGAWVATIVLVLLGIVGLLPLRAPLVDVTLFNNRLSWVVPVLGLSLVATVIAYVTGIGAARALGPKVSSFVGLSEVLFAVMFAWILLGQVPAPVQFVGGVFMLAGVALVRVDDLYSERDFSGSEPRAANSGK